MENEQDPLSGLVNDGSEYELGDLSEEEEEGEDLHRTDEDQDAGTQEGDDQFGADAEEALLRAQVNTSHFTTPVGMSPAQNELRRRRAPIDPPQLPPIVHRNFPPGLVVGIFLLPNKARSFSEVGS